MVSVGSVTVDVLPDMSRFAATLKPAINSVIDDITRGLGGKFSQPIADGIAKGVAEGFSSAPATAASAGSSSGGKFADAFKAKVDAALRSLPDITIGADSSETDRKIADIRAELEGLSNTTVGVDISDDEARAAIDDIKARLDDLGAKSPSVAVKADTLDAAAKLGEIQAEMDRLNGQTANVNVKADTSQAVSSFGALTTTALALGPALVPIGAAATAGLAGIATSAASGAAGLGVLALGFSDVSSAVGLLGKEHTAAAQQAAQSATREASSAAASVSAAQQLVSAQAALAQAREQAANQAITSDGQVSNAERSLADAERTAAQQEVTSAQQVATARQSLATTEQSVASQRASAAQQVANAEYSLTQANQQAATAQQQLNNAREQAARDLESAADRQVDANLAVQQSQINLAQAQQTYQTALANPLATPLQIQQDALNIAQAQQALVEAQQEVTNATEDNTAAQAAGVDGAPGVVSAVNAIASATHGQSQATQALADAQATQQRQQVTGAQQIAAAQQTLANALASQQQQAASSAEAIAKAQQAVGDAARAQAQQQEQAAYSIASAQRGVASAMAAVSQANQGQATAGTTALAEVKAQLDKTNPAVLAFATFITGTLQPAFTNLKNTAADGLIPGVQAGIEDLLPILPSFTAFVGDLATTMGTLFEQASKALTDPFWTQFFAYVSATAGPTLVTMGKILGDLAKGFAGLLEAFQPVTDQLGAGLLHLAGRFATFGATAGSNSGFQKFIDYIQRNGPLVVSTIGKVATALGHVIEALAPIGVAVLHSIGALADALHAVPLPVLTTIAAILGPLAIGLKLASVAAAFFTGDLWGAVAAASALDAVPLVALIVGITIAVIALAVGIVELVEHWSTVWATIKQATTDAWAAITGAFSAAWTWISGFVSANWPLLVSLLGGPVGVATEQIITHWSDITGAFSAAWAWVQKVFGAAWGDAKQGVSTVITQPVWDAVTAIGGFFGPKGPLQTVFFAAWEWVAGTFGTAWSGLETIVTGPINRAVSVIRDALGAGKNGLQTVFSDAVSAIGRVWAGLDDLFKAPITFMIDTVLDNGLIAAWNKLVGWIPYAGKDLKIPNPILSGWATGGVIPGYAPGVDSVLAMVSPGESILRPEVTRWLGPATIDELNGAAMSGGLPRFAAGVADLHIPNPLPAIGSALAGAGSWLVGLGKDAIGALTDPVKWLTSQFTGPLNALDAMEATKFGAIIGAIPRAGASELLSSVGNLIGGLFGGSSSAPSSATAAAVQAMARQMAAARGWTGAQWAALNNVEMAEAGWSMTAKNPSSGAYGIAQFINGPSEYAEYGGRPDTPQGQVAGFLNYVADRYGTPAAAWAHELRYGWYDQGGPLEPGYTLAYNGTGSTERVLTAQQAAEVRPSGDTNGHQPVTINQYIYPSPGMDEGALATKVSHRFAALGV